MPTAGDPKTWAPCSPEQAQLETAFQSWLAAATRGDIEAICTLYHPQAVLLGTMSKQLRSTPAEVRNYMQMFLRPSPLQIEQHQALLRVYGHIAMNTGHYTFIFPAKTCGQYRIEARYSFAYEQMDDGRWLIVDHHSSRLPPSSY